MLLSCIRMPRSISLVVVFSLSHVDFLTLRHQPLPYEKASPCRSFTALLNLCIFSSSSLLFLLSCLLLILCASGRLSTVTSSLHDDWCRLVSVAAIALLWLACDACVRVALFRCLPLCFSVLMVIPLSRACSFLSVCLGLWNDVKLR